ncbi:hypothetical protein [Chondromyces crocatus]|uniref:Secreted protein n=1 Tax=Chondromyces crocatus TaxID=52 RepID=A0A0K1ER92_CHOCO|nr:hypothetical protein [Chondromyces crocatus]AKT43344.1 uncharacterized protein CMC5_075760 [Chondromyces crocatus]
MIVRRRTVPSALLAGALALGPAALHAQEAQPSASEAPTPPLSSEVTTTPPPGAQPAAPPPGAQPAAPPTSAQPASTQPASPTPRARSAKSPTSGTQPAKSRGRGAIVVTVDRAAARAARALARVVYADAALRPTIDEATALALTGDGREGMLATEREAEIASVREAAANATAESAGRRLLASLGSDAGAALVVLVEVAGSRPTARVIQVDSANYVPLELGATLHETDGKGQRISWPGATETLRTLLPPPPAATVSAVQLATPKPSAPVRETPKSDDRTETPFYRSPWFWIALGAAAAVGTTAFAITQLGDAGTGPTVHLVGRIAP